MKQTVISIFICLTLGCAMTKKASSTYTLNGIWTAVRGEADGQELPPATFEKGKLTFTDTSYIRADVSGIGKGVIKYGKSKMDIYEKEGVMKGKHVGAIYKYENQQLTICYDLSGDGYPATFETKSKETLRLLVLKKEQTK